MELVKAIKLQLDINFIKVSTCNYECGYPSIGVNLFNGVLIFQINDFVKNQTTLNYFSISELKIIKREKFNRLYDIVHFVENDLLSVVNKKQSDGNKEIISIIDNKPISSVPIEEQFIILNKNYILTVKFDRNGYVNLFEYENHNTKKKIGTGQQYFIDVDRKSIVLFR